MLITNSLQFLGEVLVIYKHYLVAVRIGGGTDLGADAWHFEGLLCDGAALGFDVFASLVHIVCSYRHLQPYSQCEYWNIDRSY